MTRALRPVTARATAGRVGAAAGRRPPPAARRLAARAHSTTAGVGAAACRPRALQAPRALAARAFSASNTEDLEKAIDSDKTLRMARPVSGGLPDFVEHWTPALFRKVGAGLAAASAFAWPLAAYHEVSLLAPFLATGATALYWKIGLEDLKHTSSALPQNFPVLIHIRYILESIRPEIQQSGRCVGAEGARRRRGKGGAFRGDESRRHRGVRRGHSESGATERGYSSETARGDAAAAAWIFRGDGAPEKKNKAVKVKPPPARPVAGARIRRHARPSYSDAPSPERGLSVASSRSTW